jgi:hypothetical protein
MGVSGVTLREALLALRPEIYIAEEKVELSVDFICNRKTSGGIEECRYINQRLTKVTCNRTSGYYSAKAKRNCYRIDEEQNERRNYSRGRSDIYDILTHLTFYFYRIAQDKKSCFN